MCSTLVNIEIFSNHLNSVYINIDIDDCFFQPIWPSYQVRDLYFWSAVYTADLGSMPNDCQTGDCRINSPTVNLNTRCDSI